MIAKIDADACIGCELCVQNCPQVFKMEDSKAVVSANPIPADAEASCQEATDNCPVTAIVLE